MSASDQKFLRVANLLVSGSDSGLDFSEFKFRFLIRAAQVDSPNNAIITIYNLSDETVLKIRKEFSEVKLQVGYEGQPLGMIFSGSIKQIRWGKENNLDKVCTIYAADGDYLYNSNLVSGIVPAGADAVTEVKAISGTLANVQLGYQVNLSGLNPQSALIRDKVMFGMYRQVARQIAKQHALSWSINNGTAVFTANDGYSPGVAVKLNSLTGMIGIPEQTDEGINITCLIDPSMMVGGLLEINNKDITQTDLSKSNVAFGSYSTLLYGAVVHTESDGLYMIFAIDYEGDSRGKEWYAHIICLAVDRDTNKVKSKL